MANPTASVTVSLSGGNYSISPQTGSTGPSGLIFVNNNVGSDFYIYWVGVGAFLGSPAAPQAAMGCSVPRLGPTFDFRITNGYPFTWAAAGASGSQNFAALLAALDIQSFLASPDATKPVLALRLEGSIVVTLTPQRGAQPPHNVHPKIDTAGAWDPNNPYLSILNPRNENVDFFVRYFDAQGGASDVGPLTFSTAFNTYPVVIPGHTSLWYGFANHGEYATPAAYFTAHRYDPAGGHHTQQIPQLSGS